LIVPSAAVADWVESLSKFRACTNAAKSCGLVMADNMEHDATQFAGWERFENDAGFFEGIFTMARAALARLERETDALAGHHAPMIERLRAEQAPAPAVALPDATEDALLLAHYGFAFKQIDCVGLEDAKQAAMDLLHVFSGTMSQRWPDSSGYYIARVIRDDLNESFDAMWKAAMRLRRAAVAVAAQSGGERRAAA